jgi:chorismate mutase
MLGIFRKPKTVLPRRSLDEIKNICKIVFIDDKTFPIIEILEKNGWRNIAKLKDVDALDQTEIREAHILFVDIQGVGKKMKLQDEGLGLIIAIKRKYPNKKVIAYSAEDQGHVQAFHEGLDVADSRISKNANSYEFQFKIEKYAQEIFSLDACIERLKAIIAQELGGTPRTEDILKSLEKVNKSSDFSANNIGKIFNLQNSANLASIIQLFFTGAS